METMIDGEAGVVLVRSRLAAQMVAKRVERDLCSGPLLQEFDAGS